MYESKVERENAGGGVRVARVQHWKNKEKL